MEALLSSAQSGSRPFDHRNESRRGELQRFFTIGRNPILLDVHYDWRLVMFAATVALVAAVVTGVWPAIQALRTDPHSTIKDGDARAAGSRRLSTSTDTATIAKANSVPELE